MQEVLVRDNPASTRMQCFRLQGIWSLPQPHEKNIQPFTESAVVQMLPQVVSHLPSSCRHAFLADNLTLLFVGTVPTTVLHNVSPSKFSNRHALQRRAPGATTADIIGPQGAHRSQICLQRLGYHNFRGLRDLPSCYTAISENFRCSRPVIQLQKYDRATEYRVPTVTTKPRG
jgi:hypothetical protein